MPHRKGPPDKLNKAEGLGNKTAEPSGNAGGEQVGTAGKQSDVQPSSAEPSYLFLKLRSRISRLYSRRCLLISQARRAFLQAPIYQTTAPRPLITPLASQSAGINALLFLLQLGLLLRQVELVGKLQQADHFFLPGVSLTGPQTAQALTTGLLQHLVPSARASIPLDKQSTFGRRQQLWSPVLACTSAGTSFLSVHNSSILKNRFERAETERIVPHVFGLRHSQGDPADSADGASSSQHRTGQPCRLQCLNLALEPLPALLNS